MKRHVWEMGKVLGGATSYFVLFFVRVWLSYCFAIRVLSPLHILAMLYLGKCNDLLNHLYSHVVIIWIT